MEAVQPYPQELTVLLTAEGFENAFFELYRSQNWKSYEACYEALEEKYVYYFGQRKYTDHNSYRCAMRYHNRKR